MQKDIDFSKEITTLRDMTPCAKHVLCDCEARAHLRFRHLGQFFMEQSNFYEAPISKALYFIRNVRTYDAV
jgi:hypothetical protein